MWAECRKQGKMQRKRLGEERRREKDKEKRDNGDGWKNVSGFNWRKSLTVIILTTYSLVPRYNRSVFIVNVHSWAEISQNICGFPPKASMKLWGWEKKKWGRRGNGRHIVLIAVELIVKWQDRQGQSPKESPNEKASTIFWVWLEVTPYLEKRYGCLEQSNLRSYLVYTVNSIYRTWKRMESLDSLMLFCVGARLRPHGFQTRVDLCQGESASGGEWNLCGPWWLICTSSRPLSYRCCLLNTPPTASRNDQQSGATQRVLQYVVLGPSRWVLGPSLWVTYILRFISHSVLISKVKAYKLNVPTPEINSSCHLKWSQETGQSASQNIRMDPFQR